MKKLLIILIVLFLKNLSFGQSVDAGLVVGVTTYNGDLDIKPKNIVPQVGMIGGAFGRFFLNNTLAIRGQVLHGQLKADEKKYPSTNYRLQRGLSFKTQITELSGQLEWHFLKVDRGFYLEDQDPFLSFYATGGFGITYFNPKSDFNEPNPIIDDISVDKDFKFAHTTAILPLGAGVKIKLFQSLVVGGELTFRKTFTDYLDGFSKLIAARSKDYYFYGGLTVSYEFGNGSSYTGGNWQKGQKTQYRY